MTTEFNDTRYKKTKNKANTQKKYPFRRRLKVNRLTMIFTGRAKSIPRRVYVG